MAISYVGGTSGGGSSATLPSFAPNDFAIVIAASFGGTTPSLPSGWTNLATYVNGTTNAIRVGYRKLQSGDTTTGTWTNALNVGVAIYRGCSHVTAYPVGASGGLVLAGSLGTSRVFGDVTLINSSYISLALSLTNSASTNASSKAVTGYTNRSSGFTGDHTRFGIWDSGSGTPTLTFDVQTIDSTITGIQLVPDDGFPVVDELSITSGTQTSNSSSWTLTYPTNIAAGDLLIAEVATDGGYTSGTSSTGWTWSIRPDTLPSGGAVTIHSGRKIADGTETGTFSLTIGGSEQGSWQIIRIPVGTWYGNDNGFSIVNNGGTSSSNPDPLSNDPANWGAENTLWFAYMAADTSRTVSAYPSSPDTFTNTGYLASGGSTGATLAWARLEKNASSVDPGTFTISASDDWATSTIAVRPRQYFSVVSQTQATIVGGSLKWSYSQSQAYIKAINIEGFAQSSALIYSTPQYSEVYDTFTRTEAAGWGTSDNAGPWEINDTTGWSVSSNEGRADVSSIGQNPFMHLSKMLAPARWRVSFEYGLLNALPDGDVYIRAYDGGQSNLSLSPVGKLTGVRIRSDKTIDFARGFGTGSTFSSSGGTYGSLGDTWVYDMYVWWEAGFVRIDGKTWDKAVPGTVHYTQNTFAASADSMPGHISFYAVYLGTTQTYVKIDNFKVTKWMAEPAAQAQAYIKSTVSTYSQAQATIFATTSKYSQAQAQITIPATVPASIYYAQTIDFSVADTAWTDTAEIASTNLVALKKYLVLVSGNIAIDSASASAEVRVGYGTTPTVFTDGTASLDPSIGTGSVGHQPFQFMFVHTQGAAAERYIVQVRANTSTFTVIGDVQIVAIRLDDEWTENTNYFTNEVTADYTTTASWASQASTTFTPNGSDPWLILGWASYRPLIADGTSDVQLRLQDSVAGTLTNLTQDGEDIATDIRSIVFAQVVVPTAVSHTFSVDAQHAGTTAHTIYATRIFAMNLSRFTQVSYVRNAGASSALGVSPTWTNVATISPTPNSTGDWLVLSYATLNHATNTSTRFLYVRQQINPSGGGLASNPAYGDDAPKQSNWKAGDLLPFMLLAKSTLSSGASRDINLDATTESQTGNERLNDRVIVAVPLIYTGSLVSSKSFAQAQTQIKQVYPSWAQANADIKQTYPRGGGYATIVRETYSSGGGVPTGAGPYTHTVTYPSGVVANDYLVLSIGFNGGPGTISLVSNGWTLIGSATAQTNPDTYIYGIKATGVLSGDFTYTTSNNTYTGYVLTRYSGVDTSTPLDVTAVGTDSAAPGSAPITISLTGVTTQTNGAMVFAAVAANSSTADQFSIQGSLLTQIASVFQSAAIKNTEMDDGIKASAGATGTIDYTLASNLAYAGVVGALRPATGGSVIGPTFSQAQATIAKTSFMYSQAQAQIAKPLPGIYDYDTFTDTNGTAITSHVSDSGRTWSESIGNMSISNGKIVATTDGSNARMTGAGAADIDARMEVNFGDDGISRASAIRFRYSSNNDFLFMKIRRSSTPVNQIQLWRRAGGVTDGAPLESVTLGAGEFVANTTYELKVVALGDTIVGYIDGVEKLRTTSTFNQSATGVCITFEETLSTNQTIDNFYLRPPVLGQRSYGQAQASVIKTYQAWSQAQARITGIVRVWAQAQSGIKQTYHSWAQTQAKIATTRVHAQAQGSIRKVYQSFAQAQTKIATTRVHAQANTWIKVVNIEAVSQAQTWIKQTYIGVSQAQANIARTYQQFAQAQAKIATTRVHAQSQSNIKTTYTGYAQAQAKISTTRVFAQAQASIAKATPVSAQALALIYIPVYQRPVADITVNNWVRVVI